MMSKLSTVQAALTPEIRPDDSAYIFAVIHHDPSTAIDQSEIKSIIYQYHDMSWGIVERSDLHQPFDDSFTVLKFRKIG